jgi:hypothetical protein
MIKVVKIPSNSVDVIDAKGEPTGKKVNLFSHYALILIENFPHKSSTDAFTAYELREKIASSKGSIELETAELEFLEQALDYFRGQGKMVGSGWYPIIKALREAEPKKGK